MVFDYDLASCGGLAVLIIWILSTSGPSDDDGSPWQINKPAVQALLPCFLLGTESISQGEHPQGTDESEHLYLQTEARSFLWDLEHNGSVLPSCPLAFFVASTPPSRQKRAFTEMCTQGILLTGESPGILNIFN